MSAPPAPSSRRRTLANSSHSGSGASESKSALFAEAWGNSSRSSHSSHPLPLKSLLEVGPLECVAPARVARVARVISSPVKNVLRGCVMHIGGWAVAEQSQDQGTQKRRQPPQQESRQRLAARAHGTDMPDAAPRSIGGRAVAAPQVPRLCSDGAPYSRHPGHKLTANGQAHASFSP
jgi:hypothetical protein